MPLIKGQKLRSKESRRLLTVEIGGMRLRGLSVREIARLKNLPESSVYYYIQEEERLNKYELNGLTQERIAGQFYLDAKERMKHWWILYQKTPSDMVKARCLEGMGKEDERMITIGQGLGLIHKEPEKHEINGTLNVIYNGNGTPALLRKLAGEYQSKEIPE